MIPNVAYSIAEALWKDEESVLKSYMERRRQNENESVSLSENMRLMDWDPTRVTKTARGNEANPSRRATRGDWSTYECYLWDEQAMEQGVGHGLPFWRLSYRQHYHSLDHDTRHLCSAHILKALYD